MANGERPLVLAHRGARLQAPENTVPAFLLALELGADGVELDVRATADGVAVCIHDGRLERTTNGRGPARQHVWSELRALDAGGWFAPAFRGTRLCTLAEALAALRDARLVNVELKGRPRSGHGWEERIVQNVQESGMESRVLFSSFQLTPLLRLKRLGCTRLAWLHGPGVPWQVAVAVAGLLHLEGLHPHRRACTARYVREAASRGIRVIPWTVNDLAEARRLAGFLVAGLITDRPAEVREALRTHR
jgi:glycerophosphoryl diester phosphodiesterase